MGRIVPYMMEKINMFQTTNQVLKYVYIYIYRDTYQCHTYLFEVCLFIEMWILIMS